MTFSRRTFIQLSACSTVSWTTRRLFAQGVSSHTAKPLARPAPSGRPFNAKLVDVAESAGLGAPIIYGGTESKKYIVETMGCGCDLIDYEDVGLMDIFLLFGMHLDGTPA